MPPGDRSESHVLRVQVRDVGHLDEIVEKFWELDDTITNLVTTSPVATRPPRLATDCGGRARSAPNPSGPRSRS